MPAITLLQLLFFNGVKNSYKWLAKSKPAETVQSRFHLLNCLRNTANLTYFISQIPLDKFGPGKYFYNCPQPAEYLIIDSYRHISCTWYSLLLHATQLI